MTIDVIIAGAGVIGLACGYKLAKKGYTVAIVEKEVRIGQGTSSRNSQVIHAGMYYPTGSLKARLCVAGNQSLKSYCLKNSVTVLNTGKFIVATNAAEEAELLKILTRGKENGVRHLQMVTAAELANAQPGVRATAAIWSPETAVIDSHEFMESLCRNFENHGGIIAFGNEIRGIEVENGGYNVRTVDVSGGESSMHCRYFINAAGLGADMLCESAGFDVDALDYRIRFVKGNYFRVRNPARLGIKHLIYPAPHPDLKGLGIHITLDLDGSLRLGPDVEEMTARREDYTVDENRADSFVVAVARYLPNIRIEDIYADSAGIRPKLMSAPGEVRDFIIQEESARGFPRWINLIGIESPGLTCSLEIGDLILEYF